MPGNKVPVELCSFTEDWSSGEHGKAESVSSRSSSPKSVTESWASTPVSISEASESPEGSIISDTEIEADRIANDLDNMKITEIQAEEMMKEGADMRHVLQAAYQLKPKMNLSKKFKKGTKLSGSSVLGLLNFDSYKEKEEDQVQRQRMSRAWAEYEQRQSKASGRGVRPPPGFNSVDLAIAKKHTDEVEEPNFLVSYANGTNTLNLADKSIVVHDVTVSCVVDSCRVFIQHMKNPTFEGLKHLETELSSTYAIEPPKQLLRPIAQGSVLAVFSDSKWYRCQVVSYNAKLDTVVIKFVDHGGYTTVKATDLRQLKSDYLRLPFQAIEAYLAHVNPATEELLIDIASEILFHGNVSINLLGHAEDGIPMIQAYYYDGDYINIFTQEIIDTCRPTPESLLASQQQEDATELGSPIPEETSEVVEEVIPTIEQPYSLYEPSGYPYYPAPSYTPIDPTQPTMAYYYLDPSGVQQVYYVAGPYMMPPQPTILPLPQTQEAPVQEDTPITFGWEDEEEKKEEVTSSSPAPFSSSPSSGYESHTSEEEEEEGTDPESKPFEEWTQEDYARYYGL